MSLANYKSLCIEKYKLANPDKDIPSNMGCKWTDAEEQTLLENIKHNIGIEEIAKKHSRTKGAITARLEVIAMRMYNQNIFDIEHIENLTGLSERTIKDAIDKKGKNEIKFPKNNKEKDNEIINLKIDLQKCNEEIRELKANVKKLLELESRNKRDDIDDLKKQIQNMLDITNIKNDIIELKRFANITL
jgi:hypothetical protein